MLSEHANPACMNASVIVAPTIPGCAAQGPPRFSTTNKSSKQLFCSVQYNTNITNFPR